jgi:hypothetical protein
VWLFERWLAPDSPLSPTATRLNREAFPIREQWFDHSGKLTMYAWADSPAVLSLPLDVPFDGGITLVDFALFDSPVVAGNTLKLRLSWQASSQAMVDGDSIGFVHLLGNDSNIAQHDRLLLSLQHPKQSPLQPGQTITQGYGLSLPAELAPGSYPLIVGLYSTSTGQRLRRADDSPDDFLYLTDIIVE